MNNITSKVFSMGFIAYTLIFLSGCGGAPTTPVTSTELTTLPWDSVITRARGTEVTLMMWQGDPNINAYMVDYVQRELKQQYDIDLILASGQGSQIVSTLMSEQQAGSTDSDIDLMWINGETFYQLREINALYGPFTEVLPNSKYVNWKNPFIARDFQQPTDGYECPWGNVQMCLIYNSERVPTPPQNTDELAAWIKANPGRFTIGTDFTGMTFLKALMINLADDKHALDGPFSEEKYAEHSERLWAWLSDVKPYLWRKGKSFPGAVAPMHQLFSQGELWFTMSNNDGEVENKISTGILPSFSKGYALEGGTIQNSHYMGIPRWAGNKAGALVTLNFLISPQAQFKKAQPEVWGDGTVLDLNLLPDSLQTRFNGLQARTHVASRGELNLRALEEPAAEYMIRLYEDFRTRIVEAP